MSFNISEEVKTRLAPDLVVMTSRFLGESEISVNKALSVIEPIVIRGIVSRATDGGNCGAKEVFKASQNIQEKKYLIRLRNIFNDGGLLLNKGAEILQSTFGDKLGSIIHAISSFAGIEKSSASSLCSLTGLVAAGTIGKYADEKNLEVDALASLLESQKRLIFSRLPVELAELTFILGFGEVADAASSFNHRGKAKKRNSNSLPGNNKRRKALRISTGLVLLLIAGIIAAWWLISSKSGCK
jgi:hypothetical protein